MLSFAAPMLLLMQVGPNPSGGAIPQIPEELRNRPEREQPAAEGVPAAPVRSRLSECLIAAAEDPDTALDTAQAWRETAADELELAQSAHCLGLALVRLDRFSDASRIFAVARDEAPAGNPAYRARLGAMAGHAALAGGDAAGALPLFDTALALAQSADPALGADLETDRARVLVALGRHDEAAAALALARAANPADAQAWLLSATLARRMEKLAEAQQFIEQAATLDPRIPAIGLEAGVIAALSGRADDARRSFASVIEVAPDSAEAASAREYLTQLGVGEAPAQ